MAVQRKKTQRLVPRKRKTADQGEGVLGSFFGFEGLGGGVDGELVDGAGGGGAIEGKSEVAGEDEELVGGFGEKFLRLGAERIGLDV
jgi:hypothetical protein